MKARFWPTVYNWLRAVSIVLLESAHQDVYFLKTCLPHPERLGFSKQLLALQGEIASYRIVLPDSRSIHIREYQDYYAVHWDKYDPSMHLIEHIRYDAPEWWIVVTTAIGYWIAKDGAFLRALFSALMQGESQGEGDFCAT